MFKLNKKLLLTIGCGLLSISQALSGATITLQEGKQITGDIIKKDGKYTIVDLGFDIIRIPKHSIISITDKKEINIKEKNEGHIYKQHKLHAKQVTDAVKNYSSSVVVVKRQSGGLGSGFFINKKGYIVTNFHVIKNERHFTVVQLVKKDHETIRVSYKKIRIVAVDPLHDLAVLKIDEKLKEKILPVVFSPDANNLTSGNTVIAIGHPLGLEQTVTEGILSNPHRMFGGLMYLQIDAPINPGNSGGPLFNRYGEVVGVNNMGVPRFQGLNFAIPIREVTFLLDHLDAYAFNDANPETGYVYSAPPRKLKSTTKKK